MKDGHWSFSSGNEDRAQSKAPHSQQALNATCLFLLAYLSSWLSKLCVSFTLLALRPFWAERGRDDQREHRERQLSADFRPHQQMGAEIRRRQPWQTGGHRAAMSQK